jgi:1-pyrroline-5-carboxylate dehydrogenase
MPAKKTATRAKARRPAPARKTNARPAARRSAGAKQTGAKQAKARRSRTALKTTARRRPPRHAPARHRPTAAASQEMKITYATLSAVSDTQHARFDAAAEAVRANLERRFPMLIANQERWADEQFPDASPIDTRMLLGYFQKGTRQDARDALAAARGAFGDWGRRRWQERVRLLRRAAELISERIHAISAVVALEIGKNRMEAWGDVQETADLISYYCDQVEANDGYRKPMTTEDPRDPGRNTSVLKPYGVWVVISPFNFPFALAGGPAGGALVAGNTVVFKPASDTPYSGYLLAEAFRDAGLPDGVFNFVTGPGSTVGDELVGNPDVNGITFTGSYDVGMRIYRDFASGRWPRPCIAEMGGKNPAIVARSANLELAATGIMRSAFGLQGQKCSACSRVYVDRAVQGEFTELLAEKTRQIAIGDPSRRENWFGPVANRSAYESYAHYVSRLGEDGRFLTGGRQLTEGELAHGYFCAPTVVADLPLDHPLWKEEMFLPITTVAPFDSLDEAMRLANGVDYGLTAGFYSGDDDEVRWFFDNIQAGVTYVNRRPGATTGAWPGYQPFGGWKGSGSSGKSGGSLYYVPQYLHEQSQTWIHNPV